MEMKVDECRPWRTFIVAGICFTLFVLAEAKARTARTKDGSEQWGYIDVRQGAHMFWWWYRSTASHASSNNSSSHLPIILWLQGVRGEIFCNMVQGGSGVGVGDFSEMGPLDSQLRPRQYAWTEKADLIFVENPVGTGFSYVDDPSLLATNNHEVAHDLLRFLQKLAKLRPDLSTRPFFVFCESYGGKFASELGVLIYKAVAAKKLDLKLEGIALGDTWVSPLDSMYSWGSFLQTNSRLDASGAALVNEGVHRTAELVHNGQYENATQSWENVSQVVSKLSNQVNFYNILYADEAATAAESVTGMSLGWEQAEARNPEHQFPRGFGNLDTSHVLSLADTMNTVVRTKLGIIPPSVQWETSSNAVFQALTSDFMKDTIHFVDELLELGVKVAIYSGQLDLICSTPGTEAWVQRLKWGGLREFNQQSRTPLYCNSTSTGGFVKKHKNLSFYWILDAGHYVPIDNPCTALQMVGLITS